MTRDQLSGTGANCPVSALTPGVAAEVGNRVVTVSLVTLKVPSPFENATGMVFQPAPPTNAISVIPSPLKSPVTTVTPGVAAEVGNKVTASLVTLKVPFPFENATAMVFQPAPPTNAISVSHRR